SNRRRSRFGLSCAERTRGPSGLAAAARTAAAVPSLGDCSLRRPQMATDLRRLARAAVAAVAAHPLAVIAVLYVGVRTGAFLGVEPTSYLDTLGYNRASGQPLISKAFLAGERAWTVPLFYKV